MSASAILVVIITIFLPPLGVFLVAGCGADLLINILLTILGYFPGHIHAFYIEYVYYERRERALQGGGFAPVGAAPAAGVYSGRVQSGGFPAGARGVQGQQQGFVPGGQQGYGTV